MTRARDPVIVAGAGIGGLAAALALAQRGFRVVVLEQAAEIGEIGAGVQLAPNAFAAFDALGVGERARSRAVYTDRMVMMDAVDETLVGEIPTGAAFQARFANPYAVIHRADLQPLDNLELFGMSPLYSIDSYRAMGRNAAAYALGHAVGPVPTQLDNFARAKLIVTTTLLHARETAAIVPDAPAIDVTLA